MNRSEHELLQDALEHLRLLHQHLGRGDLEDETIADAVCLRLAAAIEAIHTTDGVLSSRVSGNEWPIIWSTRNRIAHIYAYIDLEMIRATVEDDLPSFEAAVNKELSRMSDPHD